MKTERPKLDEEALVRVLDKHEQSSVEVILRLAWSLGLSAEEMSDLKWSDISFTEGELRLPDRSVPLDADTRTCLQKRYDRGFDRVNEYVVISEQRHVRLHRVYISKLIHETLCKEEELANVDLKDLRNAFVIRQLQQHDWSYVARISGLTVRTLRKRFSSCCPPQEKEAGLPISPEVDEYKLWLVIQQEGNSPVGLALWMSWNLGMTLREIISLTWEQANPDTGVIYLPDRQILMGTSLKRMLTQVQSSRSPDMDPHVLLTPRSRRPYDEGRLFRIMQESMIRGGVDNIAPGELSRRSRREEKSARLLRYANEHRGITRDEAAELLQIGGRSAWRKLHRLVEEGQLIKIGVRYFTPGTVVAPEEQYETIRSYLLEAGSAYRNDLANLLQLDAKPCGRILRRLVAEGALYRQGQRYLLPSTEHKNIEV